MGINSAFKGLIEMPSFVFYCTVQGAENNIRRVDPKRVLDRRKIRAASRM
jgi:hypothetical protein